MDSLPPFLSKSRTAWALCAVVAAAYAWWVVLMPSRVFWAGDMGVKYVQVESLLRQHWRSTALVYPSRDLDPRGQWFPFAVPFATRHGERFYSVFPIAFPALSAVLFWLFGVIGLYVIPICASAATLFALPWLCDRLGIGRFRALAPILIGLGSPLFFYSVLFWEHTLAATLCTFAVCCLLRAEGKMRARWAFACGLLVAACAWFRPEAYCFLAALLVAIIATRWRRVRGMQTAAWVSAGACGPLVVLWTYQWLAFGHPLGAHYVVNVRYYAGSGVAMGSRLIRLIADPNIGEIKNLWLMTPFLLLLVVCVIPPLRRKSGVVATMFVLCVPTSVLLGLSGYFNEGLLAVTPLVAGCFLLFGPAGESKGPADYTALLGVMSIGYVVLVAMTSPVVGGLQLGPRLLLPIVPIVLLLALYGAQQAWQCTISPRARQIIACSLFVLGCCGVLTSIFALQTVYTMKTYRKALIEKIMKGSEPVVVADHWSTPQEIAPIYFERKVLLAPRAEEDAELLRALANAGVRRFLFLRHDNRGTTVRDQSRFVPTGVARLVRGEWLRAVDLTAQWYVIGPTAASQF